MWFKRLSPPACVLALCLPVLAACAAPSPHNGRPLDLQGAAAPTAPYDITVARGDTLSGLAARHNVPLAALARANNLAPPYTLYAEQRLTIPVPRTYRVRYGDTLSQIAAAHNTTTKDVARLNNRHAPYPIYAGETLRLGGWIPGSDTDSRRYAATSAAPATPATPATPAARQDAKAAAPRAKPDSLVQPSQRAGRFVWPVHGQVISSFGPKDGGLRNDGINISVPPGTPVVAAENGVVAYAGNELKGYGNMILVQHSGGYVTAYAHNAQLLVARGDTVTRGQKIASSGATGGVSEPQVHFEIRRGAQPVNPMPYLGNTVAAR